jgi:hypothetical protein
MTAGASVGAWEQTSAGLLDCLVRAFEAARECGLWRVASDGSCHSLARERLARTLSFEVISDCSSFPKPPNKAPEPTPTAVTSRAMEMNFEMKTRKYNRIEARGAPAAVVAHL